jgi:hypothetical protein
MPFQDMIFMQRDCLPKPENTIFSIYCTEDAIELRVGCEDYDQARLISAHKCYENAHAFGQSLVTEMDLPFKDLAGDR